MRRRAAVGLLAGGAGWLLARRAPGQDEPRPKKGKGAKPAARRRPFDLLRAVRLDKHVVGGKWAAQGKGVACEAAGVPLLQLPYRPPAEYDLELVVRRTKGGDTLVIGVPMGDIRPAVVLDAQAGRRSGLDLIDGKSAAENAGAHEGGVLSATSANTVVCQVREAGIVVNVDGRKIVDWQERARLSSCTFFKSPDAAALYVASYETGYLFTRLTVTVVTGEGKVVR